MVGTHNYAQDLNNGTQKIVKNNQQLQTKCYLFNFDEMYSTSYL